MAKSIKNKNNKIMPIQSYAVCISQQADQNPTKIEFVNELGFGNWIREKAGFYTCSSTTPFNINKNFLGGTSTGNTGEGLTPVGDFTNVVGYVCYGFDADVDNNIRYFIESYDLQGNLVDLSQLYFDTNRIYLPKLEVYP